MSASRAQALRGDAETKTEQADARLEQRYDQIARQRAQAELRAKSKRDEAERERSEKTRRAEQIERERVTASEKAANRADNAVSERAPQARLETLDAKSDALRKREEALAARRRGPQVARSRRPHEGRTQGQVGRRSLGPRAASGSRGAGP